MINKPDPHYQVRPCDGHRMEALLNDMWEEGYKLIESHLIGVKQVENQLMPNKATMIPMILCTFELRGGFDA